MFTKYTTAFLQISNWSSRVGIARVFLNSVRLDQTFEYFLMFRFNLRNVSFPENKLPEESFTMKNKVRKFGQNAWISSDVAEKRN